MTPDEYCAQKAAPPGSSLYYATLFLPGPLRPGVVALYALRHEITSVRSECSDPGVGRVKLAWWREELERLAAGSPRHPVTRALAPALEENGLPVTTLGALVEATESTLSRRGFARLDELALYCRAIEQPPLALAARMSAADDAETAPWTEPLALGIGLTWVLQHARDDLADGRSLLPRECLEAAGLDEGELLRAPASEAAAGVVGQVAGEARQALSGFRAVLPERECPRQGFARALAAMAGATVTLWDRRGYPVPDWKLSISPLRRLWIAWRSTRR